MSDSWDFARMVGKLDYYQLFADTFAGLDC